MIEMENIILVQNLTKNYKGFIAIDNISFQVNRGEFLGIVGPDGSGKSTLMKLLAGIIKPTDGIVKILDKDIHKHFEELKPFIGYISQNFSHYQDLTVEENLEFFAEIHKVSNFKERIEFLLEFSRLKSFRKTLISNLSGGMKQKLALISSLIYEPQILLLDEPTTGVDPISRREFWFLLNQLVSKGKTIVFATPYLDEAERFHNILLLNKGKLLAFDTPESMISNFNFYVAEIVCSELNFTRSILHEFGEVQVYGDRLNVIFPKGKENYLTIIQNLLESKGIKVQQMTIVRPRLENIFFNLLKGEQS